MAMEGARCPIHNSFVLLILRSRGALPEAEFMRSVIRRLRRAKLSFLVI
jgi:hypothetical protein